MNREQFDQATKQLTRFYEFFWNTASLELLWQSGAIQELDEAWLIKNVNEMVLHPKLARQDLAGMARVELAARKKREEEEAAERILTPGNLERELQKLGVDSLAKAPERLKEMEMPHE